MNPTQTPDVELPMQDKWNGKFTVSGGIRLAWGCSIHDAVMDVLAKVEPDENKRRELAYQISTNTRDRFEKTPAHKMLDKLGTADILAQSPADVRDAWQPIETAPKDGTVILCCVAGFIPSTAMWIVDNISGNGCWHTEYAEAYEDDEALHEALSGRKYEPTHWMPLPQPPTNAKE